MQEGTKARRHEGTKTRMSFVSLCDEGTVRFALYVDMKVANITDTAINQGFIWRSVTAPTPQQA